MENRITRSFLATYLIEIPHAENTFECRQVVKLFVESGSHLLVNAHRGCKSGVHKSWFINDFNGKEEAWQVMPPFLRHTANIIELAKFTKADIAEFAKLTKNRSRRNIQPGTCNIFQPSLEIRV
ncbi:MAG: hypothetical protein M3R50_12785 [Bacteroidota bacterium]|nr:hypothetical protein [Bacteroidota bacterium]